MRLGGLSFSSNKEHIYSIMRTQHHMRLSYLPHSGFSLSSVRFGFVCAGLGFVYFPVQLGPVGKSLSFRISSKTTRRRAPFPKMSTQPEASTSAAPPTASSAPLARPEEVNTSSPQSHQLHRPFHRLPLVKSQMTISRLSILSSDLLVSSRKFRTAWMLRPLIPLTTRECYLCTRKALSRSTSPLKGDHRLPQSL